MLQECFLEWRYLDTDCGLIAPWYSLPCLQWLKAQDTSKWVVFEYGSGYSTGWWRANCERIDSVDHDKKWAIAMAAQFQDKEDGDYTGSIEYTEKGVQAMFDCIIVDGISRERCVEFCIQHLKSGGYLIIDNYNEGDYDIEKTKDILSAFKQTLYKQPTHSKWVTAVFQK
jgi:hypothetical protein